MPPHCVLGFLSKTCVTSLAFHEPVGFNCWVGSLIRFLPFRTYKLPVFFHVSQLFLPLYLSFFQTGSSAGMIPGVKPLTDQKDKMPLSV